MSDIYLAGETDELGILLLHAYTGSPADMNLLGNRLNAQGYGVLMPAFSGHGEDRVWSILQATPSQWWDDTLAAFHRLAQQYDKVMVFGLSMGGIFATKLLSAGLEGLVAGGSFNSPIITRQTLNLDRPFTRYAKHSYAVQGNDFDADQAKVLHAHHEQMVALLEFSHTVASDLSKIDLPYYMAQSGQDELIDPEDSYVLQDALINSRIDFHWFPDNTHVITTNQHRRDFEQSVEAFIHQRLSEGEFYQVY